MKRVARLAKLDFVSYVGKREFVASMKIDFLLGERSFLEVVSDFYENIVPLEIAAARVRRILAKTIGDNCVHYVYIPRLIKWVCYRGQLNASDQRYVQLSPSPPNRSKIERDRIFFERYGDIEKIAPMYPMFGVYHKLLELDERDYLEHWKQAFPDAFATVMNDHRVLAQLFSAGSHGVDHVSDIYGAATESFEVDLPCLSWRLKNNLLADLGGKLIQGLVCLNFDPLTEYPEFFSKNHWWQP